MGRFGAPHDSTVGVPEVTVWIAFIIILYIILRVRWQLWYDKKHGVKNPLLIKKSKSRTKTPNIDEE